MRMRKDIAQVWMGGDAACRLWRHCPCCGNSDGTFLDYEGDVSGYRCKCNGCHVLFDFSWATGFNIHAVCEIPGDVG